jgi:hypothetical protein
MQSVSKTSNNNRRKQWHHHTSHQLPSPEHKGSSLQTTWEKDRKYSAAVPQIKRTKSPTRCCRICTKIKKSVKSCGFPPSRYVTWNITPKEYYSFQSVPCEMFIQVWRSFRNSMLVANPPPFPQKKTTINKLSYSQNITSTSHYFSTFTAGIEAIIIAGYQLLYPLIIEDCCPCAQSVFHRWFQLFAIQEVLQC